MNRNGEPMSSCARDEGEEHTRHPKTQESGFVSEIFCSIQGEGLHVGERQIFVRTAGCSATCTYCDTAYSKRETPRGVVHGETDRSFPNPIEIGSAAAEVRELARQYHPVRTVSITGGEPLEQSRFVGALADALQREGFSIYLDTNGIEVDGLTKVLPFVKTISMDIKLPSATGRSYWPRHLEFLRRISQAGSGISVFAKVVVEEKTQWDEVERAARLVSQVNDGIPLVLQPEGAAFSRANRLDDERRALLQKLLDCRKVALQHLSDVRVIPQFHTILGVR